MRTGGVRRVDEHALSSLFSSHFLSAWEFILVRLIKLKVRARALTSYTSS